MFALLIAVRIDLGLATASSLISFNRQVREREYLEFIRYVRKQQKSRFLF